ncbi:hypothetical protein [Bartonella sp. CL29QHWL]|uniref:hypothetical protein n=1 Tax=Bartonella sp. CL29QHWL TaxID=3243522 RepID=UPI0035CFC2F0
MEYGHGPRIIKNEKKVLSTEKYPDRNPKVNPLATGDGYSRKFTGKSPRPL